MSERYSSAMDIKQILFNTANSIRLAESVIIDNKLQGNAKNKFLMIINRLRGVEKDLYLSVLPEYADIIKKEIIDNWETHSFQNITTMSVSMSEEQRRLYEEVGGHILADTFKVEENG